MLSIQNTPKWACLALAVALALTILSYRADIAGLQKSHAVAVADWERQKAEIATLAQQETEAALKRMREAQDQAALLDQTYRGELDEANQTIADLRRDVASGDRRVRLATKAAASCNATGDNSKPGSMGDAAAVELTAEAAGTVLDIREGIEQDHAKIKYLQDYINNIVKNCTK